MGTGPGERDPRRRRFRAPCRGRLWRGEGGRGGGGPPGGGGGDAGAIATPTMVLGAGSDWVVKNSTAAKFFERLNSPAKEMFVFPGMGHALFHETGRAQVVDRVRSFLDRQFAKPAADALPVVIQ